MKLVCMIGCLPLWAFQNWFIKSGSFAPNIQLYKTIHLIQLGHFALRNKSQSGARELLPPENATP
jgi:hypothetical protein